MTNVVKAVTSNFNTEYACQQVSGFFYPPYSIIQLPAPSSILIKQNLLDPRCCIKFAIHYIVKFYLVLKRQEKIS